MDGLNFSFIKAAWDIVKRDFCNMLTEFHKSGRLSEEINTTFFTLIPKVPNVVDLKEYRPISLVGCIYKLLSKILSNRMKEVLPSIVGPYQGVFVRDRQILDGVLIANELVDARKWSKKPGVIFKIDVEKAYDHVEWSFADYTLRFGFGERWCS